MNSTKTAYATAYYRLLLLIKSGRIGDIVSIDLACTSIQDVIDIDLVQGLFVQYLNWPREPFYMNEFAALFNVLMAVVAGIIIAKPIHYILNRLKKSIA